MALSENAKKILNTIDSFSGEIIDFGNKILKMPELGYKEFKTSSAVCEKFEELSVAYEKGTAITGVRGKIGNGKGVHICIIGEMDAVVCPGHKNACVSDGAAHACGHNEQLAAMIGSAYGLAKSGVLAGYDCTISFLLLLQRNILIWSIAVNY